MVEGKNMQMVAPSTTCSKMKALPSYFRKSKKQRFAQDRNVNSARLREGLHLTQLPKLPVRI
jgi:hypothetical protein